MNPQLQGESTLLSGSEFENAITEMVSMGFSKEEASAAMRAAYNNPERAIDYLLNVTCHYEFFFREFLPQLTLVQRYLHKLVPQLGQEHRVPLKLMV